MLTISYCPCSLSHVWLAWMIVQNYVIEIENVYCHHQMIC